ncbi:MAG TPA: YdcF family protein [Stellaceae bacterium]|nr:YdcF family protein [Stellaceae bacterium]
MFFVLSKALDWLVNPATLLAILVLGNALAALTRRRKLAATLLGASAALVVLFGILPGSDWLSVPLEARFPANPPLPAHVAGIIALGGTERLEQSAAWGQPTISDPAPLVAFLALGRRYPNAQLVFTGGVHSRLNKALSEADVVKRFVKELDTEPRAIIYEDRSRNTYENATLTRALVKPKPGETWILVCEAIAMPRAVGAFRAAGWNVLPYPAGYLTARRAGPLVGFNVLAGFELGYVALHEWVGLIAYRIMGYTNELFPG